MQQTERLSESPVGNGRESRRQPVNEDVTMADIYRKHACSWDGNHWKRVFVLLQSVKQKIECANGSAVDAEVYAILRCCWRETYQYLSSRYTSVGSIGCPSYY